MRWPTILIFKLCNQEKLRETEIEAMWARVIKEKPWVDILPV